MAYEHAIALADEPYGLPTSRMGSRHAVWRMACQKATWLKWHAVGLAYHNVEECRMACQNAMWLKWHAVGLAYRNVEVCEHFSS